MRSQKKPAVLRLERAVVDRLRLGDLAVRPGPDRLGRRQADPDRVEIVDIEDAAAVLPVAPRVPAVRIAAATAGRYPIVSNWRRIDSTFESCCRHASSDIETRHGRDQFA